MILDSITLQQILGGIGVLVGLAGYVVYFRGIFQGKIKPHAFSWFVWAVITLIGFLAQVADGAGPGAWVTGFTAAMSFILVVVGLGSSSRALIEKSDIYFFVASLFAVPLWYFTGDPLWSVILITIIDAVAFIPTFRKAYIHTESESVFHASCAGIKFVFGIFALQHFSITTVLYPASLIVMNIGFVAMLVWRRHALKNKGS